MFYLCLRGFSLGTLFFLQQSKDMQLGFRLTGDSKLTLSECEGLFVSTLRYSDTPVNSILPPSPIDFLMQLSTRLQIQQIK